MSIPVHIIEYCAQECARQRSGELSVLWMVEAWAYALQRHHAGEQPTLKDVKVLGALVEPEKNRGGLRTVGVAVGYDRKMDWRNVPRALEGLMERVCSLSSDEEIVEWYKEYEEVHPFADGNGRTGSLLHNWLKGTLEKPAHVPDYYDPNFWRENQKRGLEQRLMEELGRTPGWTER